MKKLKNYVSIHEAKNHLNKHLLPRQPGKENIVVSDDFDDPLPPDVLNDFWK